MYKVYKYNDYYLELEKDNVPKEDMLKLGKILANLRDDYDDGKIVGFVLENGYYAVEVK